MGAIKLFKGLLFCVTVLILPGCAVLKPTVSETLQIKFLDEYVLPDNLQVDETLVGGLSDLDYDGTWFYAVCDLPSSPRIYKMDIALKEKKIDTVRFLETIRIDHQSREGFYVFDSEGLLYHPEEDRFTVSSEGAVSRGKDPFITEVEADGTLGEAYRLPEYFRVTEKNGPRNNGVFEGLSHSADGKGIWAATEFPLRQDGPSPKIFGTYSPVRFTYFDREDKTAKRQFLYPPDRIRKIPLLPYGLNGVSAILEYQKDRFLVLERGFSAGYGRHGMRVLLYVADAGEAGSSLDISDLGSRKEERPAMANKKLLLDFNSIRKKLSGRIIDNLEGLAIGPRLENGNQSLLVISDNNFNSVLKQKNQIILLELVQK